MHKNDTEQARNYKTRTAKTFVGDGKCSVWIVGGVGGFEPPTVFSTPLTHCQIMYYRDQLYTVCIRFTSQFCFGSSCQKLQPQLIFHNSNTGQMRQCQTIRNRLSRITWISIGESRTGRFSYWWPASHIWPAKPSNLTRERWCFVCILMMFIAMPSRLHKRQ